MGSQFKSAQSLFDKRFRYYKRLMKKEQFKQLEDSAIKNPADMWSTLSRLNNPPRVKAALEIVRSDETISCDRKEVLER